MAWLIWLLSWRKVKKETIQYDACDENDWTDAKTVSKFPILAGNTIYPINSACGQLGQKYVEYGQGKNGAPDDPFICPRQPKMEVSARTNAHWYGAAGPMFAAPDSAFEYVGKGAFLKDGKIPRWDHHATDSGTPQVVTSIVNVQAYNREDFKVYIGQKGGKWIWDTSLLNDGNGSVQDCGWWGRGVIQTTGRANFGKLNHYLGRSHLDPKSSTAQNNPAPSNPLYADLDLCKNP